MTKILSLKIWYCILIAIKSTTDNIDNIIDDKKIDT